MDHPFPDSIAPCLQTVVIVFRTEPLKGLCGAEKDLSTSLNVLVEGSLLKSEAAPSLFFFVLLPTVYIYYPLWHSTRPKKKLMGEKNPSA